MSDSNMTALEAAPAMFVPNRRAPPAESEDDCESNPHLLLLF